MSVIIKMLLKVGFIFMYDDINDIVVYTIWVSFCIAESVGCAWQEKFMTYTKLSVHKKFFTNQTSRRIAEKCLTNVKLVKHTYKTLDLLFHGINWNFQYTYSFIESHNLLHNLRQKIN